ncbi:TolC family protein, partial [Stutzerimonas stutzeri]
MTAKALAAPLLLALALSACSSAPQHADPQMPEGWFSAAGAHPADAESLAVWWRQFDDPQLSALVSRAMQQNHDVRLAMARVTAARAQLRQSRAGLLPSFDLPASASRQWNENDQEAEPDSPLADFIPDNDVISFDTWELALQATWELDLFGATRARRDSAARQLRSAEAQTIAARLAVASNTAQGYLQLRALQGQRALLVEGIEVARELERIAGLLFHAGEVTRLDVEATSAERASLEADLDELDIHLAEAQLALDTLLAEPPGSTAARLAASAPVPLAEQRIAPGQPIDLLRRRP